MQANINVNISVIETKKMTISALDGGFFLPKDEKNFSRIEFFYKISESEKNEKKNDQTVAGLEKIIKNCSIATPETEVTSLRLATSTSRSFLKAPLIDMFKDFGDLNKAWLSRQQIIKSLSSVYCSWMEASKKNPAPLFFLMRKEENNEPICRCSRYCDLLILKFVHEPDNTLHGYFLSPKEEVIVGYDFYLFFPSECLYPEKNHSIKVTQNIYPGGH